MKPVYSLCAVALLAGLLVMGAGAVTVTVDKHDYKSGETISPRIAGMTVGTNYSMKVSVDQFMKAGVPSAIGNTNITVPFSLGNDSFNVTNVNTTQNSIIIGHWWPSGAYEEAVFNGTSVNGVFTRTYAYEFNETGFYTSKWIATPVAGASIVTSVFWINGTKMVGPDEFTATSSISTVNPAVAWIEIYENNRLVTPEGRYTIEAAPLPTNIPTLSPNGGSDSDSYPGSSGTVTTVTTSGTGTTGTGTVSPTGTGVMTTSGTTPAGTPTAPANGTATTAKPTTSGSPFAFAALGALGCAALLFAGRMRR